jgi:hypothetical protein
MSDGLHYEWRGLVGGLAMIVAGIYGIFRSVQVARRNKAYIDSGKETYFEERRAWEHYPSTRPATDPARIKRAAWLGLVAGTAVLLFYSPISIFHWS